eukprot:1158216-Pelagomonas_calceolata.AAC.8
MAIHLCMRSMGERLHILNRPLPKPRCLQAGVAGLDSRFKAIHLRIERGRSPVGQQHKTNRQAFGCRDCWHTGSRGSPCTWIVGTVSYLLGSIPAQGSDIATGIGSNNLSRKLGCSREREDDLCNSAAKAGPRNRQYLSYVKLPLNSAVEQPKLVAVAYGMAIVRQGKHTRANAGCCKRHASLASILQVSVTCLQPSRSRVASYPVPNPIPCMNHLDCSED